MFPQQIEGAAHAAQHAEAEDVDFHEAEGVDVVFVPLDDLAVDHGGGLDRHEVVETIFGQNETAGVLRQMPREADQFAGEVDGQAQTAVVEVEVEFGGALVVEAVAAPVRDLRGEGAGHVLRQSHGFADIAHGAAAAVADDGGAERGAVTAIGVVDPLDDFLAPFMLEVDVDVGRFAAFGADETFEQQAASAWGRSR